LYALRSESAACILAGSWAITVLSAIFVVLQWLAIVLSTHHVNEAELIADELLVLDSGKTKFYGTKSELRQLTKGSVFHVLGDVHRELFVGVEDTLGLNRVRRILGGVEVHFKDVVTVREVMTRLDTIENMRISSLLDVSASTQALMDENEGKLL
jgi:ABC-type multidrug transport system ATPase subunit